MFEQVRAGLGLVDEPAMQYLDAARRFEVRNIIGSGAMGRVYLGYDTKLGREVALKVMREDALGGQFEARLRSEARTLATLQDHNILAIYDIGRALDGKLFIATQYVDGPTLREWQRDRAWPEILPLYVDAGRGLLAAHNKQIVHRDFKPDNVFVEERASPRVYVGDFGLASNVVELDESKGAVGTPGYMAPELHRRGPSTVRSDQFALCTALWEACVGARPWPDDEVGPVPARPETMPRWLYRLLAVGLDLQPEARHESLAELLDGLSQAERRAQTSRRMSAIGALTSFAVASGYSYGKEPEPPPIAPVVCKLTQDDEVWSDRVDNELRPILGDELVDLLGANNRERWQLVHQLCQQRGSTPHSGLLDRQERCAERWREETALQIRGLRELEPDRLAFADGYLKPLTRYADDCSSGVVQAPLAPEFRRVLRDARNAGLVFDTARAESLGLSADEIARRSGTRCPGLEYTRELGWSQHQQGRFWRLAHRPDLARAPLLLALEIATTCDDPVLLVNTQLDLAQMMAIDFEDLNTAEALTVSARGRLKHVDGPGSALRWAELHEAEGFVRRTAGDFAGAITHYERALATLGGHERYWQERAKLFQNIGAAQQELERNDLARVSYARARAVFSAQLGQRSPAARRLLGSVAFNEALMELYAGQYSRASELFEELFDAPQRDLYVTAATCWLLAQLELRGDEPPDERMRERAIELLAELDEMPGLARRSRADALSSAGVVLARLRDEQGIEAMRAALEIWRDKFSDDENLGHHALNLAVQLVAFGEPGEARELVELVHGIERPLSEADNEVLRELEQGLGVRR